jgi:hypothetical protein
MKCTLTFPAPRYQVLCVCTAPAIPSLPAGAAAHRPHQTRLPSRDPSTSNPPLTTHPTCTVLTRKPQPSPTPWISSIDIVSHDFHPVSAATGPQLNYPVSDQPTISSLVPFLHGSHFTQTQQPVTHSHCMPPETANQSLAVLSSEQAALCTSHRPSQTATTETWSAMRSRTP